MKITWFPMEILAIDLSKFNSKKNWSYGRESKRKQFRSEIVSICLLQCKIGRHVGDSKNQLEINSKKSLHNEMEKIAFKLSNCTTSLSVWTLCSVQRCNKWCVHLMRWNIHAVMCSTLGILSYTCSRKMSKEQNKYEPRTNPLKKKGDEAMRRWGDEAMQRNNISLQWLLQKWVCIYRYVTECWHSSTVFTSINFIVLSHIVCSTSKC